MSCRQPPTVRPGRKHKLCQSVLGVLTLIGSLSGAAVDLQALPAACPIPKAFATHPTARDYIALGLRFDEQQSFACAIAAFEKAAEFDPAAFEPHWNLAMLMGERHRFEDAAKEAEIAVGLAPGNIGALTTLARIRTRLGQTGVAIAIFRNIIALEPNSAEAHVNLGIALADSADLPGALEEFTTAVRLAPQAAAPHFNLGRVLADLRRHREAETELQTASKLEPNSAAVLYRLALTERQLAHYDRSAELLRQVITLDPQNEEARVVLGQDLARLEEPSNAIAQWKRVLQTDPENTQALYGLIRALSSSNSEELKTYQQRYAAIQEKNHLLERVQTLSNFAIAAAGSKDYPKAVEQMTEALQLCANCRVLPVLHKNLGLIYLRSGNLVDGERELRTSLSLDSKDPEVLSTLARLDSLRGRSRGKN